MLLRILCLALLCLAGSAPAAIRFEITKGVDGALPIAIVPLAWEVEGAAAPLELGGVISADLARTGRFKPIAPEAQPQQGAAALKPDFAQWRTAGIDYVVVGRIARSPTGYSIRFQLFDALRGSQLLGYSIPVPPEQLRRAGHRVADMVYEKLIGQPGAASTRIAYITEVRDKGVRRYRLMVADSDGENAMNQNLSINRASSVASALYRNGVGERRIVALGFGEGRPVATNSTDAGKQLNRRVELTLMPITAG